VQVRRGGDLEVGHARQRDHVEVARREREIEARVRPVGEADDAGQGERRASLAPARRAHRAHEHAVAGEGDVRRDAAQADPRARQQHRAVAHRERAEQRRPVHRAGHVEVEREAAARLAHRAREPLEHAEVDALGADVAGERRVEQPAAAREEREVHGDDGVGAQQRRLAARQPERGAQPLVRVAAVEREAGELDVAEAGAGQLAAERHRRRRAHAAHVEPERGVPADGARRRDAAEVDDRHALGAHGEVDRVADGHHAGELQPPAGAVAQLERVEREPAAVAAQRRGTQQPPHVLAERDAGGVEHDDGRAVGGAADVGGHDGARPRHGGEVEAEPCRVGAGHLRVERRARERHARHPCGVEREAHRPPAGRPSTSASAKLPPSRAARSVPTASPVPATSPANPIPSAEPDSTPRTTTVPVSESGSTPGSGASCR
jgi:hypothetical protein